MGDPRAFTADLLRLPSRPSGWLAQLLNTYGPAMRTLWLMHEPPSGTPLSQPNSVVAGNREWQNRHRAIHAILTISGHDHQTPLSANRWWCRIGSTTSLFKSRPTPLRRN